MQLDSYLELFLTMYGWAFANIIGEIIVGTGLVVVPFAVILFQGWREAKEQGLQGAGVMGLLERSMTRLVIALFVMSVCFATSSVTSIGSLGLSHEPMATAAEPSPPVASLSGGTGSSFDAAMADAVDGSMSSTGSLDRVPLWWFTVMAISSGVNNAIRAGLSGSDNGIRMVETMARSATIHNSRLKNDMQRFRSECLIPMRSKLHQTDSSSLSPTGRALLDPGNTDYGPADIDWMGSKFFREEPGFYDTETAKNPVPGFVVDFSRDPYYNPSSSAEPPVPVGQVNPDWGMPTCKQWWEDETHGLRQRMIDDAYKYSPGMSNLYEKAKTLFSWSSNDKRKDDHARLLEAKAKPDFVNTDGITGEQGIWATIRGSTSRLLGSWSTFKQSATASFAYQPLVAGLPMLQAIVLMAIYMFLPLVIFLSGYGLRAMFMGTMALFTVKLWAGMWFIAAWLDQRLVSAMYPGADGSVILQGVRSVFGNALGADGPSNYKRMLLNIMMLALFVGLPLVWTSMMAWMGWYVGGHITQMASSHQQRATAIGGAATGATIGAATRAGRAASSAARKS